VRAVSPASARIGYRFSFVVSSSSSEALAAVKTMTRASETGADASERLIELAHLSSAVGHYLINAYSATVSNAELIRSPVSRATDAREQAALATSIIDTALHASSVARKLIDWARSQGVVELNEPNGEPRNVDLNQLVGELIECERNSGEGGIEWRWSPGAIPAVQGDRNQLRTMLERFVQNAREALPGGTGTIEISTNIDSRDWVTLTIGDSGCGMSQEVQRRAGEPFFTTKEGHAGVGLTIAQLIWRRHRGAFSIESSPGAGTTVRLSILPSAGAGASVTAASRVPESSSRPRL
jgi:signal transduction histidine kinase